MRRSIYICFLALALLAACMEDKSNYDYTLLNEIRIDSIGDYRISVFDTLRIEPKVSCSAEDTELAYVWYKYEGKDGTKCDTMSLEKDLEYKVTDLVGQYTVYLQVIDRSTGLSEKTTFLMDVIGKFDRGLLVLGELEGKSHLAFINEAGEVVNIYGGENGDMLGSRPVCIGDATCPNINTIKDIMVLCDDERGGVVLSNADFTVSKPLEEVFFLKPGNFHPQAYYRGYNSVFRLGTADFIISGGKLHARTTYNEEGLGRTVAFNPVIEGDYQLCPYAIVCPAAYLFYDNRNGRFLTLQQSMFSLDNTFTTLPSGTEGFDPADMDMECHYLSEAAKWNNRQSGYGLFTDKATGQLVGLRFSMNYYTDSDHPMSVFAKTPIPATAEGIAESSSYAMSLSRPSLYYVRGSKVYFYGIENGQSYPVYDVDTVADLAGSVVDRIYMEYLAGGYQETNAYGQTLDEYNSTLYVSSSREGAAGAGGSIHVLRLAPNGTVESRTALYKNCCGKTTSMIYKR